MGKLPKERIRRAPDHSIRSGGTTRARAAETKIASKWEAAVKIARFHFHGSPLYDAYTRNLQTTNYRLGGGRPAAGLGIVTRASRLLGPIHDDESSMCLLNNKRAIARTMYPRVINQFYGGIYSRAEEALDVSGAKATRRFVSLTAGRS